MNKKLFFFIFIFLLFLTKQNSKIPTDSIQYSIGDILSLDNITQNTVIEVQNISLNPATIWFSITNSSCKIPINPTDQVLVTVQSQGLNSTYSPNLFYDFSNILTVAFVPLSSSQSPVPISDLDNLGQLEISFNISQDFDCNFNITSSYARTLSFDTNSTFTVSEWEIIYLTQAPIPFSPPQAIEVSINYNQSQDTFPFYFAWRRANDYAVPDVIWQGRSFQSAQTSSSSNQSLTIPSDIKNNQDQYNIAIFSARPVSCNFTISASNSFIYNISDPQFFDQSMKKLFDFADQNWNQTFTFTQTQQTASAFFIGTWDQTYPLVFQTNTTDLVPEVSIQMSEFPLDIEGGFFEKVSPTQSLSNNDTYLFINLASFHDNCNAKENAKSGWPYTFYLWISFMTVQNNAYSLTIYNNIPTLINSTQFPSIQTIQYFWNYFYIPLQINSTSFSVLISNSTSNPIPEMNQQDSNGVISVDMGHNDIPLQASTNIDYISFSSQNFSIITSENDMDQLQSTMYIFISVVLGNSTDLSTFNINASDNIINQFTQQQTSFSKELYLNQTLFTGYDFVNFNLSQICKFGGYSVVGVNASNLNQCSYSYNYKWDSYLFFNETSLNWNYDFSQVETAPSAQLILSQPLPQNQCQNFYKWIYFWVISNFTMLDSSFFSMDALQILSSPLNFNTTNYTASGFNYSQYFFLPLSDSIPETQSQLSKYDNLVQNEFPISITNLFTLTFTSISPDLQFTFSNDTLRDRWDPDIDPDLNGQGHVLQYGDHQVNALQFEYNTSILDQLFYLVMQCYSDSYPFSCSYNTSISSGGIELDFENQATTKSHPYHPIQNDSLGNGYLVFQTIIPTGIPTIPFEVDINYPPDSLTNATCFNNVTQTPQDVYDVMIFLVMESSYEEENSNQNSKNLNHLNQIDSFINYTLPKRNCTLNQNNCNNFHFTISSLTNATMIAYTAIIQKPTIQFINSCNFTIKATQNIYQIQTTSPNNTVEGISFPGLWEYYKFLYGPTNETSIVKIQIQPITETDGSNTILYPTLYTKLGQPPTESTFDYSNTTGTLFCSFNVIQQAIFIYIGLLAPSNRTSNFEYLLNLTTPPVPSPSPSPSSSPSTSPHPNPSSHSKFLTKSKLVEVIMVPVIGVAIIAIIIILLVTRKKRSKKIFNLLGEQESLDHYRLLASRKRSLKKRSSKKLPKKESIHLDHNENQEIDEQKKFFDTSTSEIDEDDPLIDYSKSDESTAETFVMIKQK
ncbi:formin-related [Anaeramoeba ignava]|uniref:Formin-related n=1 Tax=Anaeramoeba ignava TaxID=1746090 RepID=A0A9Q0RHH1_ANAIG|nr:formin-related [Anaeramoeba ignava]